MSPDDFRRLSAAGLNVDQIALVMEIMQRETQTLVDADEARKAKGRERWHKWHENKAANVSKHELTLANVDKRLTRARARVEDKTSNTEIEPQVKKVSKQRATRLPTEFEPDIGFAVSLGLSPSQANTEAAKFRDYWSSKGSNATKTDWPATWRNWIRSAVERMPKMNGTGPPLRGLDALNEKLRREIADELERNPGSEITDSNAGWGLPLLQAAANRGRN